MNSRERMAITLNHKEADRVPIDLAGMNNTGIAAIAYNRLKNKLGLSKDLTRMYDFLMQLAYPDIEVIEKFHIDTIDAGQAFLEKDDWREWQLDDGSKCAIPKYLNIETDSNGTVYVKDNDGLILGKKPKTSLYTDQCYWVYKDFDKIPDNLKEEDLKKYLWRIPAPPMHLNIFNDRDYKLFIDKIRKLRESTEYSILLTVGCSIFEVGTWIRGFDNFLCDIYLDRKGVKKLLDNVIEAENYFDLLNRVLKGVGNYIDILVFGDDLGFQKGPLMSSDVFKDIFKPSYKKMWELVHSRSNCKVFFHSCGSIFELIPDLIDAGLDILNPVQTTAFNMDPEMLKKEFGKDIIFWGGGCNTQDILPFAKPREVKEDVKRNLEILARNGGFVFNQNHNILADVPPENIIAMFEAAYEYGSL